MTGPSASEGRRQVPARRRDGATAAGAHDAARALRGGGTSGPHAATPTPRRVAGANAPDASAASGNSTRAARRTRASAASGDANAAAARRTHNRDEGRAPPSGRRNQPTPDAGSRGNPFTRRARDAEPSAPRARSTAILTRGALPARGLKSDRRRRRRCVTPWERRRDDR